MNAETVSVLEGNTFVVSDRCGNIDASSAPLHGLFAWDTRSLSRWVLTIDGQPLQTLSRDDIDYFSAQFFLVPGTGTVYIDADLSVMRRRSAGNGFREKLLVRNEKSEARDIELRLEAAADFADLFEVKDALSKWMVVRQQAGIEVVEHEVPNCLLDLVPIPSFDLNSFRTGLVLDTRPHII